MLLQSYSKNAEQEEGMALWGNDAGMDAAGTKGFQKMKTLKCHSCVHFKLMTGALPPLNPDVFDTWHIESTHLCSSTVKKHLRSYVGACFSEYEKDGKPYRRSFFVRSNKKWRKFTDKCKYYMPWYKYYDTMYGGQFKGKDLNIIIEANRKRYREQEPLRREQERQRKKEAKSKKLELRQFENFVVELGPLPSWLKERKV
jgi:hypothetical protein